MSIKYKFIFINVYNVVSIYAKIKDIKESIFLSKP